MLLLIIVLIVILITIIYDTTNNSNNSKTGRVWWVPGDPSEGCRPEHAMYAVSVAPVTYVRSYATCLFPQLSLSLSCTCSSVAKDRLSDAGGPRFDSQTGRVRGKSTPSLWRDKHPVIQGLWPPEHHAGHSIRTNKTPPSQKHLE